MGFRPTVSTRFPEAVAMRFRILNVGKGSSNDVDLEKFGYCNYIAPKHAIIFFDDVSIKFVISVQILHLKKYERMSFIVFKIFKY